VILGIGNDTVDIRRIERTIERHGARFLERVFTPIERSKAERRTERIRAATYAKRFAAKEAAAKALGTGFRAGVFFRDLGVVNLGSGQPTLRLTGGAAARLAAITPAGMQAQVALTMTDEYPYASAVVVISAVPAAPG
jgi:holo-[acyl-carrier protein] synthase